MPPVPRSSGRSDRRRRSSSRSAALPPRCCWERATASRSCAAGRIRSAVVCSCRPCTRGALRGGGEPLAQMRADFVRAKRALAEAFVMTSLCTARRPTTPAPSPRPSRRAGASAATCSCWPARWARGRPRSPRASAPGSASTNRSRAPRSRSCAEYEGRLGAPPSRRLPARALVEVHDLGLGEMLDGDGAVTVIEWGDVSSPRCRSTTSRC